MSSPRQVRKNDEENLVSTQNTVEQTDLVPENDSKQDVEKDVAKKENTKTPFSIEMTDDGANVTLNGNIFEIIEAINTRLNVLHKRDKELHETLVNTPECKAELEKIAIETAVIMQVSQHLLQRLGLPVLGLESDDEQSENEVALSENDNNEENVEQEGNKEQEQSQNDSEEEEAFGFFNSLFNLFGNPFQHAASARNVNENNNEKEKEDTAKFSL